VTRTVARVVSVTILFASIVSATAGLVIGLNTEVAPGIIVVHGDPSTPGMGEVIAELEHRATVEGDALTGTFGGDANPVFAALIFVLLLWVAVGTFIVWRRPGHWAGWLFIITGAAFPMLTLLQGLTIYGLKVDPGSVPLIGALAVATEFSIYLLALVPLLILLYPDGHLPSPRWRWAVIGLVGGTGLSVVGFLVRPGPFNAFRDDGVVYENPLGIDTMSNVAPIFISIGAFAALFSAISTVVGVRQRFRRSTGEERQQMRLMALAASVAGTFALLLILMVLVGGVFGQLEDDGTGTADWIFGALLGLAAFSLVLGVPAAYLVAIFRHGLWDLDVVVKRAVVAVVLTLLLIATGIVVIAVPITLLGGTVAIEDVLPGIVAGALIWPLIRVARRVAGRIAYGRRASTYEVLTAFSERVGETYATADVLPRMVGVLASSTGATAARVLLHVGADVRQVARWPDEAEAATAEGEEHVVPVVDLGEELGALALTMPPSDPMTPAKERLVRDLASQAGLVLRNVRLVEELRASRQRLVAAQDEERRKIERNLHDGAQQQLVALQVQLRLAEQLVGRDPEKERELLHRLQGAAATAVDDLRDLARGIYPPVLADQGLAAALEAQARRSPVPVTVEPDGIGRYSREVESAVYFCALEALNNVAKYAEAGSATVKLWHDDGHVAFEVRDDGRGFDPATSGTGTGLQGMADRLDAIGGSLDVTSSPGEGTTVAGRVPATPTTSTG
jgi:signal transduction histidine kinase